MLEDFVRAVEVDGEPQVSGLDGLVNVQVLEAVMESASSGRVVSVS
jgi:predicted dehydrogenase